MIFATYRFYDNDGSIAVGTADIEASERIPNGDWKYCAFVTSANKYLSLYFVPAGNVFMDNLHRYTEEEGGYARHAAEKLQDMDYLASAPWLEK